MAVVDRRRWERGRGRGRRRLGVLELGDDALHLHPGAPEPVPAVADEEGGPFDPLGQVVDVDGVVLELVEDPFEHPVIQPNYLAAESDRRVLLAGMKLARRLLGSQALSKYYDREEFPGPHAQSDDDLLTAAKQRGTTTFHLMGTCRMAPDNDPTSVVDDQLRVRGIEGLRVVDASIMPTMPSANLNASVLMIAEKAADMIRADHP